MKPHERKEKYVPTAADQWARFAAAKCAQAAIDWLKGSVNLDRPIRSLKREEFERLAVNVTSTWIVLVSERMQDDPEAPDSKELAALLR